MSEVVRLISAMAERGLIFTHRDISTVIFQNVSDCSYKSFKDWDEVAEFVES